MSYISSSSDSLFESFSVSTTPTPTSPLSLSSSLSPSSSSSLTSSPLFNPSPIVVTTTTTTSTSPSKLRQIAPAPPSNNDYDINDNEQSSEFEVYHIPKGYEVLLVPRNDSNLPPVNISADTKRISPATAADNLKIQQQKTSALSASSNGSNNSSWRRRKQNGHIPRPKNCFMAYREHIQHEILSQNPGMNNKYVSVVAAEKWNKESEETKNYWREKAQLLKIEHGLKYPNYKFAPKKKQPKSAANNNDSNDDVMSVKTNKVIKKTPSSSSKILTEDMAKNLLNNANENFENNGLVVDNMWSHYRSSSVESITSWTSGESSTTPSTPSLNDYNPNNNYNNDRSSSPLRFEACVDINSNNNNNNNNNNNTVNLNELVINNDPLTSFVQQQNNWNGLYNNSMSSTTELQNDFYHLNLPTTFNYQENMPIDTPFSYYIADDEEYDLIDHHHSNDSSSQQQLFNINQQQQQQHVFY